MKLTTLHEAKYDHGRTLEKIMSFVNDRGEIRDGYAMRINAVPIQYIGWYDPTDPNSAMYDPDGDTTEPFFVITPYNQEDPDVLAEEDFLPHVEVYELRRII
jgi:hypothetical protein